MAVFGGTCYGQARRERLLLEAFFFRELKSET